VAGGVEPRGAANDQLAANHFIVGQLLSGAKLAPIHRQAGHFQRSSFGASRVQQAAAAATNVAEKREAREWEESIVVASAAL